MADKKSSRYSGIGGQAVLEGIMMKNKEKYAVAVRKPDGDIAIELDNYQGVLGSSRLKEIPFVRGVFNFVDSLVLGMKCLNFSASFYVDEEEGQERAVVEGQEKEAAEGQENKATEGQKAEAKETVEAEAQEAEEKETVEAEAQEAEEKGAAKAEGHEAAVEGQEKAVAEGQKAAMAQEKAGVAEKKDKAMNALVTCFAVVLAVGIFVVLPYFLASLLRGYILNPSLMAIVEGALRILIFILYVWGISAMKDIKRLYSYHGAEHKCINCIEGGKPLTVGNVMESSRLHRRCGTSFIFFVLLVSIVMFMFIRLENPLARVVVRILLMPVVAGISYEIIRLAGRNDFWLVRAISAPGMAIQRMTTKEPDESMAEVAIKAVEAVFDWKAYLKENFSWEEDNEAIDGITVDNKTIGS